jgi:alpha-L-fucosidase
MLVDIVSRKGNLLLNFPLPSRMLDPEELKIFSGITGSMGVNHEAIYGTRPWKIFGAGSSVEAASQPRASVSEIQKVGAFNGRFYKPLAPAVRFISKGETLYTFVVGWPAQRARIPALCGPHHVGKIRNIELLGVSGPLTWRHDEKEFAVHLPLNSPREARSRFQTCRSLRFGY